jgi:hypothetical protein
MRGDGVLEYRQHHCCALEAEGFQRGEKQPRNLSLTSTLGCFHGSCLGLFGLDTLDIAQHANKAHSHFVRSAVDSLGGLGCKRCLWASHLGSVSSCWAGHAPMTTDRGAHLACTSFLFGI